MGAAVFLKMRCVRGNWICGDSSSRDRAMLLQSSENSFIHSSIDRAPTTY